MAEWIKDNIGWIIITVLLVVFFLPLCVGIAKGMWQWALLGK